MTKTLNKDMTTFAASDAKNKFGSLLDAAQRRPITIEKKGRPVAVLLSMEDYERFEALDDAYWVRRAQQAMKEGSIGVKRSKALHESLLHA